MTMTEMEYEESKRQREEERRIKKLRKLKEEAVACLAQVMKDDNADRQSRVRAASLVLEYTDSTYERLSSLDNDIL